MLLLLSFMYFLENKIDSVEGKKSKKNCDKNTACGKNMIANV